MHALDHLISKSFGAALEGLDQCSCTFNLGLAWRKGVVAWRDLVRVNQALSVKSEPATLLRLSKETVGIVKTVEYTVEDGDSGSTCCKDDSL